MAPRIRNSFRILALAALPALALPGRAQATFRRSFSMAPFLYNNSVWNAGENTGDSLSSVFIGPSWGPTGSTVDAYADLVVPAIDFGLFQTPAVNLGRTGFQLQYDTAGAIGFNATPYYNGGTMNLTYGGTVTVSGLPKFPKAGDKVGLTLGYATAPTSNFSVTSPQAGLGLEARFRASGDLSATGWFLGDQVFSVSPAASGGKLPSFNVNQSAQLFTGSKFPDGRLYLDNAHASQIATAIGILNVANPFPVAPSLSIPDLSVTGDTIDATSGALSGSTVSTFLTAETSLTSWALALIPGAKDVVSGLLLDGSYPLPDTSATVGWDFASLYWDMNLGFASAYTVKPTPTLGVDVYAVDAQGNVAATPFASSNSAAISFNFPNAPRILVKPRVALALTLTSKFGFGATGEIGSSPAKFTLDGGIGSGDNAQTYHVDVDPAHADYTFNVGSNGYVKTSQVALGTQSQTFGGVYVAQVNTADLTPYIVPAGADDTNDLGAPLSVDAYSHDTDQDYYTVDFGPEQGYTFLSNWASLTVDPAVSPVVEGGTGGYFDPRGFLTSQTNLRMQFRQSDLKPGHYTLKTNLYNPDDLSKITTYRTPLNVNYVKGVLDGQFYQDGDPAHTINRITADGSDKTLQVTAENLYAKTEVVMNGDVVLPRVATQDVASAIPEPHLLQFTVPADVAKRFAGSINTIQLRTPDLSGDGKGFTLSAPKNLFIVAKAPTLTGIHYKGVANGTLPLAPEDVTFEVDGTNFSQATKLTGQFAINGQAITVALTTAYVTPTALRATLSADQEGSLLTSALKPSLAIVAVTPKADVPADHYNPATTSGGNSASLPLGLAHRTPTITRFDPAILVKDGGAQTVKVYGDNLVRANSVSDIGALANALQTGNIAYPSDATGQAVPYLLATYPANSPFVTTVGKHAVTVAYADAQSLPNSLSTQYGVPAISAATSYRVKMGPSGGVLNLSGAPFYGSGATLALRAKDSVYPYDLALDTSVTSTTALTANVPSYFPGTSMKVFARNLKPGGGDSNAVTVALLEGDPSTMKVVPGPLVYDRVTGYYKESFAVTYTGTRDPSGGIELVFNPSTGVKLVNAAGTSDGQPYLSVVPKSGQAVSVVAVWSKTASATINPVAKVAFPY